MVREIVVMVRNPRATASLIVVSGWILSAAAAGAAGTPSVTVAEAPGGGQPVAARSDGSGNIHLLYNAKDGPQYVKSTDRGKTFSTPIPVVDPQARKPGLEFSGWDLAVGKGGRVHVAMGTNAWKLKLPKQEWALFYARLNPGAAAFSPVQNLNRTPSEGFSLAADDQGNVTACWLSDKLYANVSHDNGTSFAATVEIDPAVNPCNCCTTSAAYGAGGSLAVLYREETNNDRDMFLLLWDQRRGKVSRTRVSTTPWKIDACPMTYYAISPAADGFVAVWPTRSHVYFTRLDGQGALLPPVETKSAGTTGMRCGVLALCDSEGNTLVAWNKDGQLGWQLYDRTARPSGHGGAAKTSGKGIAGIVERDGHFVLFR
jgi:hypothetical protein